MNQEGNICENENRSKKERLTRKKMCVEMRKDGRETDELRGKYI